MSDEQARMAAMLGLNPNDRSSWPTETIDRLIALETCLGREALFTELSVMMTPPVSHRLRGNDK